MFCENCGNKLAEGSAFCTNCGSRVDGGAPVAAPAAPAAAAPSPFATIVRKVKANKKAALIGAAALVAIVAIILVISLVGGGSAEGTVEKFMDSMVKADVSKMMELVPDDVLKVLAEEEGYDEDEVDEMIEDLEDQMKDSFESMEDYMGKMEISYKIKDQDTLSKSKLKDLKEVYEDEFDLKVKEAVVFEVEVTMEFEDYGEEETEMEIIVVKIGNKWYIDALSTEDLF